MINCFKNEKSKLSLLSQLLLSMKQNITHFRMSYQKSQRLLQIKGHNILTLKTLLFLYLFKNNIRYRIYRLRYIFMEWISI